MKFFVVILRYLVEPEKIDAARPAHLIFLDEYYQKGNFIASGKQNPKTGGVIIARATDREILENILKYDPFYIEKLAEYSIYEFHPNKASNDARAIFLPNFND